MSDQKVGGVYVTVDAVTDGLRQGVAEANQAAGSLVNNLNKVDDAAAKTTRALNQTGTTANNTAKAIDNTAQSFGDAETAATAAGTAITKTGDQMAATATDADRASKAIDQTGRSAANASKQIDQTTQAISRTGQAADNASSAMQSAGTQLTRTGAQAEQAGNDIAQAGTQAQTAGNNTNGLRNAMGNLGFQLQDTVVQLQAGTSAFVVLAQQGSQVASAFGPNGAIIGAFIAIAAALGGVFFSSLTDSTTAAEKLDAAMKELAKTAIESDAGLAVLTDELGKLAKVSEQAAQSQIRAALIQAEQAIKGSATAMGELVEKFSSAPDFIYDISDALATMNRVGTTSSVLDLARKIGQDFGYTGQQAQAAGYTILKSLQEISNAKSPEVINRLREDLLRVAEQSKLTKEQQAQFITGLNEITAKALTAANAMQTLTEAQKKTGESLQSVTETGEEARKKIDELVSSLEKQAAVAGMTQRGVALYVAEQGKATQADIQRINAAFDVIEAEERKAASIKKAAEARREETRANERAMLIEAQAEMDAINKNEQRTVQLRTELGTGIGADPVQRVEAQIAAEMAKLQEARDRELISLQEFEARKTEIAYQGAVAREAAQKQVEARTKSATELALEEMGLSYRQLGNMAAGSLALVATGAMTGKEAIAQMARTILTQAIGALIQMAIVGQTTRAAETAAGAASAGALTAAYAPAAAAASIATAGASASAGAAAAIGAVTAITGALGGGRLYGGPVSAGGIYPITENGRPEILQQGANSYLLPGSRGGKVISNQDMQAAGGGAANVVVNVNNYGTGVDVRTETKEGPDRETIINVVVADILSRGKTSRAIEKATTARGRV